MSRRGRAVDRIVAWDARWGPLTRSFWLLVISVLMVIVVAKVQDAVHGNKVAIAGTRDALSQVQSGRHVAIGTTCATLSAVTSAGRRVILQGAQMPENAFTRFLEQHGYPPQRVRIRQARVAGKAYARSISAAVDRQIGRKGDSLVRADGTIDCDELQRLSASAPGTGLFGAAGSVSGPPRESRRSPRRPAQAG